MIKETVTIEDCVAYLNDFYKHDKDALRNLIENRVVCNKKLADHPSVQVVLNEGRFRVGLLGVLNGLFGFDPEDRFGAIAAIYDVVCPDGHKVDNAATIDNLCSECNKKLMHGKLRGFKRIR